MKHSPLTTFNNSLVIAQTKFQFDKFTDLNSLHSLYGRDRLTTYKGMIRLFNQKRLMNTPLLDLIAQQNAVEYVNGPEGRYRYGVPFNMDFPYIVEDLSGDNPFPGIDGQKFKVKVSENIFSNTDLLTYDFMWGEQLYVTPDEIYEESDGWVLTVSLPQGTDRKKYFPKDKLRPGTPIYKLTNVNGEYDTQKSSIGNRTGMLELENQMGGHRSVYHWITGYAHMLETVESTNDKYAQGEILNWIPKRFMDMNSPYATLVIGNDRGDGKPDSASAVWYRRVELLLFDEMNRMEENDMWWAKGGVVEGAGRRKVKVNTGLFEQLKNGNYFEYNKLTLDLIESVVRKVYENTDIPVEQRYAKFKCGYGALVEISKLLADDFKSNNPFLVTTSLDSLKGLLYGKDVMNLGWGYRFTSKRFVMAGTVEFEWEPAFDNFYSRAQSGLVGDFPIESYTLAIFDVTKDANIGKAAKMMSETRVQDGFNDSANIVQIKPKGWDGIYWGYEKGTIDPTGFSGSQGMVSSNGRHGFGIWMQSHSAIWLRDASRSVLLVKARPLI